MQYRAIRHSVQSKTNKSKDIWKGFRRWFRRGSSWLIYFLFSFLYGSNTFAWNTFVEYNVVNTQGYK
jgi:hypothetical protein